MAEVRTDGDTAPPAAPASPRRKLVKRILSIALSLVIVGGIFFFAIPRIADYRAVWHTIQSLTPLELGTLVAAMVFNLFTYWFANMAALPRLRLWPAAVLTQTTTSVANTIPAGGAIAIGLTFQILRSWGFTNTSITLYVAVTGVWNIFMKLALPVLSILALVLTGSGTGAYVIAAVIGLAVLGIAVTLFALVFWREALARRIGDGLGRVISKVRAIFRKPPLTDAGERAVRFRGDTITLVEDRWIRLTVTTILSQLALWFVLLLCLRHMGISEQQVSWAQTLAVFSFGRLLTALPITPGGLGLIELGYIGGLVAAGGDKPKVVAAVLLFRALTYGIQIPIGAFTYLIWRSNSSWRREPDSIGAESEVAQPA
jgi:uncharacterized protein (TIRG00374 family)